MKESIFVFGGCRSGKSSFALDLCEEIAESRLYFIATCRAEDHEMKARVARHQAERSDKWKTLEEPVNIHETVNAYGEKDNVILVDCLTLWVSNLFGKGFTDDEIGVATDQLASVVKAVDASVILVSNEVGQGIVPENAIARRFRDEVGRVNQCMAACVENVVMMAAGIPVHIKKGATGIL